jgi:hypothetical protein
MLDFCVFLNWKKPFLLTVVLQTGVLKIDCDTVTASFCSFVSALPRSCGVIVPFLFVIDESQPSVAVKGSPSPGAQFVLEFLIFSSLPSALE